MKPRPYSHVIELNGGDLNIQIGGRVFPDEFAGPMRGFNGQDSFAIVLWKIPENMDCAAARCAGVDGLEYIQAAGDGQSITVEVRQAGGAAWGADWVRYVIGHHDGDDDDEGVQVEVQLPHNTEIIRPSEVFDADEAAQIFYSYYKSGDIPAEYSMRPVEGYTRDGRVIDVD